MKRSPHSVSPVTEMYAAISSGDKCIRQLALLHRQSYKGAAQLGRYEETRYALKDKLRSIYTDVYGHLQAIRNGRTPEPTEEQREYESLMECPPERPDTQESIRAALEAAYAFRIRYKKAMRLT